LFFHEIKFVSLDTATRKWHLDCSILQRRR